MFIAGRLRALRQQKKLTQSMIEERAGLQRCYISRVENGYTAPSIATLEKWARGLKVPLYQIFFEEEASTAPRFLTPRKPANEDANVSQGEGASYLARLRWLLSRIDESDRQVLLDLAKAMKKRSGQGRRGR